jgi:hypothetical protein
MQRQRSELTTSEFLFFFMAVTTRELRKYPFKSGFEADHFGRSLRRHNLNDCYYIALRSQTVQ